MIRLWDNHASQWPQVQEKGSTLQKDLEMENELLNDVKRDLNI